MARGGSGAKAPPLRVPGLPIRDCAGSCNSCIQMCTTVNAIDVTARRQQRQSLRDCIWFQDGTHLGSASTVRVLPLPPPLNLWLILDFPAILSKNFTLVATHFFGQHDSRSNLAESQYPPSACRTPKTNSFLSYVVRHGGTWALDPDGFLIEAFFLDIFFKGIGSCGPVLFFQGDWSVQTGPPPPLEWNSS